MAALLSELLEVMFYDLNIIDPPFEVTDPRTGKVVPDDQVTFEVSGYQVIRGSPFFVQIGGVALINGVEVKVSSAERIRIRYPVGIGSVIAIDGIRYRLRQPVRVINSVLVFTSNDIPHDIAQNVNPSTFPQSRFFNATENGKEIDVLLVRPVPDGVSTVDFNIWSRFVSSNTVEVLGNDNQIYQVEERVYEVEQRPDWAGFLRIDFIIDERVFNLRGVNDIPDTNRTHLTLRAFRE